jgi:DNA-binding response OmpR family regulator
VDLHGGVITAQSEGKDQGATFVISLPTMAGVAAVQEPALPDEPRPVKPLRILMVEDHADTARIMRWLLTSDGHIVQWAGDVAAALKLAAENEFDLLLSDLGLSDGTGADLMRTLRRQGSTLPGIVLSGYGQDQDIARSRDAGFAAHLVKPLSPGKLRDAIAALVAR